MGNFTARITIFEPQRSVSRVRFRDIMRMVDASRALIEGVSIHSSPKIRVVSPCLWVDGQDKSIPGTEHVASAWHKAGITDVLLEPYGQEPGIISPDIMDICFAVSSGSIGKVARNLGFLGHELKVEGLPVKWSRFYREFRPGNFAISDSVVFAAVGMIGGALGHFASLEKGLQAVLAGATLGALSCGLVAAFRYAMPVLDFESAPDDLVSAYRTLLKFQDGPASQELAKEALGILSKIQNREFRLQLFKGMPAEKLEMLSAAATASGVKGLRIK